MLSHQLYRYLNRLKWTNLSCTSVDKLLNGSVSVPQLCSAYTTAFHTQTTDTFNVEKTHDLYHTQLSLLVYVGAAPLPTISSCWSMLGQCLFPLLSMLVYVGAVPLPTLSFQLKGTFLRCIYTDQYLCSLWEKHLLPNGELPFAVPLIVSPYLCLAHWFSCSICSTYGSYTWSEFTVQLSI